MSNNTDIAAVDAFFAQHSLVTTTDTLGAQREALQQQLDANLQRQVVLNRHRDIRMAEIKEEFDELDEMSTVLELQEKELTTDMKELGSDSAGNSKAKWYHKLGAR